MKSEWQVNALLLPLIIGLTALFSATYAEITRECERALEKDTKTLQVENEKCEQEFGDDLPCGNLCLLRAKGFIDSDDEFQTEKYLKYMKIYPKNVVRKLHKEIPKCEDYYVPTPAASKDGDRDTCKQNEKFLTCLETALMNACEKPTLSHAAHSRKTSTSSRRVSQNENIEDEEDEEEEAHHYGKKVTATANRHAGHDHGHRSQKAGLKTKSRKTPVVDDEDRDEDVESENDKEESESGNNNNNNNEDSDLQPENSAATREDNDNDLDDEKTQKKRKKRQDPDPDTTTADPSAVVDDSTVDPGAGGGGADDTTVDPNGVETTTPEDTPLPDVGTQQVDPPVDPPVVDPPVDPPVIDPPVDVTEPPPEQMNENGHFQTEISIPIDGSGGLQGPSGGQFKPQPGNDKLALLQGLTDDLRAQLTDDREPPQDQIQDLENLIREVRDHPNAHAITPQQIHEVGTVLDNLREKMRKNGRSAIGIDRIDDFLGQIRSRVPDDFVLPPGDGVTVIPEIHFPSEVAGEGGGGGFGRGGDVNDADASARRKEKWLRRRAELVANRGTTNFGRGGAGAGGQRGDVDGGAGGGLGGFSATLGGLGRYGRIRNRLGRLRSRLGRGGRRGRRGRLGLRGLKRRGRPSSGSSKGAYRRYGSQVFEQKLLIEVKNPNNIKDFQVTFKGIPNANDE